MTSCVVDKIIYFIIRETCRKTRTSLDLLYKIQTSLFVGGGGQNDPKEKKTSSLAKGFCVRIRNPCLAKLKKIKPYSTPPMSTFCKFMENIFCEKKWGGELITQVFVYVMLHRRTNGFLTRFTTDFLNVTPFTEV